MRITVRGDSGFCREELMAWCEAEGVDYVLGLVKNEHLTAEITAEMATAAEEFARTGKAARVFTEFGYQARQSWSRPRRVIAKAEHLEKGTNPRFVVTSHPAERWEARRLYEELYCGRGEIENRLKESAVADCFRTGRAQRTCAAIRFVCTFPRWPRVLGVLVEALRRLGLKGTEWAQAQCDTMRLKVLKVGALIRITVRRVWVSLASGYPYQELFQRVDRPEISGCRSVAGLKERLAIGRSQGNIHRGKSAFRSHAPA